MEYHTVWARKIGLVLAGLTLGVAGVWQGAMAADRMVLSEEFTDAG